MASKTIRPAQARRRRRARPGCRPSCRRPRPARRRCGWRVAARAGDPLDRGVDALLEADAPCGSRPPRPRRPARRRPRARAAGPGLLELGDLALQGTGLARVRLAQLLDLGPVALLGLEHLAPDPRLSRDQRVGPSSAVEQLEQLLALLARLGADDLLDLRLDRVVALSAEGRGDPLGERLLALLERAAELARRARRARPRARGARSRRSPRCPRCRSPGCRSRSPSRPSPARPAAACALAHDPGGARVVDREALDHEPVAERPHGAVGRAGRGGVVVSRTLPCGLSKVVGSPDENLTRMSPPLALHPRRGDHLRRAARGRLDPYRRAAPRPGGEGAAPGVRGARRRRTGGLRFRLGPHDRRRPALRALTRDRAGDRRGRVRGDHRRRARAHGGGQPRRPRRRRDLGRAQHPAPARAGDEPLRRHRPHLRLLLHPQAHVRPLLALDRRAARRLRHARRAVRGDDPDPDRGGHGPPGGPRGSRLLVGPARLGPRGAARRRAHLPAPTSRSRRSPTRPRTSSASPAGPRRPRRRRSRALPGSPGLAARDPACRRSRPASLRVSRAVATAAAAIRLDTSTYAATGTQPPGPSPAIQAAAVGAKPPIAKPIWVPIAVPHRRTRVGNISP